MALVLPTAATLLSADDHAKMHRVIAIDSAAAEQSFYIDATGNACIGGSNNELRFYEGVNYVGFVAPALTANQIYTLPITDGSSGQFMQTNGSGVMTWATPAGGGDMTSFSVMGDTGLAQTIVDGNEISLLGGTGIASVASATNIITFSTVDAAINHNVLDNYEANEHIDHTTVSVIAGTGLTGGGTIAADRTFNVDVGIGDDDIVQIDATDVADNDYAKFTTSGVEGKSYSEVKEDLSLNLVENTAISTWVGTSNITTVGTIGTGTWGATDIGLAHGGTGASLADPAADRIMFWDDSASTVTWLTVGDGLSLVGTSLTASVGTDGVTAAAELTVNTLIVGDTASKAVKDTSITVDASSNMDMGAGTVSSSTAPSLGGHLANKDYVDGLATGSWWSQIACATTAGVDLTSDLAAGQVIDGHTLVTGEDVLVKNQQDLGTPAPKDNGVYTVPSSGAASRSTQANTASEIENYKCILQNGTANDGLLFYCTTSSITLGTTPIYFESIKIAAAHNDTTGLQGGSSTERYHLTSAQHTIATQAASATQAGYITSTDWGTFNGKAPTVSPTFTTSITIQEVACGIDTGKFLVSHGGQIKYRSGAELLSDIGGAASGSYVEVSDFTPTAGIMVSDGTGGFRTRSIDGTTNEITVTYGDGASDNPTISLPDYVYMGGGSPSWTRIGYSSSAYIKQNASETFFHNASEDCAQFDNDGNFVMLAKNDIKFADSAGNKLTIGVPSVIGGDYAMNFPAYADAGNKKTVLEYSGAGSDQLSFQYQYDRVQGIVFDSATAVVTGDEAGNFIWQVPEHMDGYTWEDVEAQITKTASTSGNLTINVYNITDSRDALSTAMTVDVSEHSSKQSAIQPVIVVADQSLSKYDRYRIDVDAAGTGAKGLTIVFVTHK